MRSLFLFLLFVPSVFAHLGATPAECEKIYGTAKFSQESDGKIQKGYQPTFEGFGGAIVLVIFKEGKAVQIRYRIEKQKQFTPDQFSFFATMNPLGMKKKFVEVGPAPDRKRVIWATEDNTAYIVVEMTSATMDLMTRAEAIAYIKQMPTE